MTNIIDYTYFKGKLVIANAVETSYVQTALTTLITEEQYSLLNKMLGPVLYDQFKTWYETLPLDTGNVFNDLLNGKVFTSVSGRQVNWVGLKNDVGISPIANYCYCEWQERNVTQSVSMGEVKTKSQNAITGDPIAKSVAAWNMFVEMMCNYVEFANTFFVTEAASGTALLYSTADVRLPEFLQVGVTPGLVAFATSFVKSDYENWELSIERVGFGTMIPDTAQDINNPRYGRTNSDGSANDLGPKINLLEVGDSFQPNEQFVISFEPKLTEVPVIGNYLGYDQGCFFNHDLLIYRNSLGL